MDAPELLTIPDFLLDLEAGQPVTLLCRTTTANIYLKAPTVDGRIRWTCADDSALREIPYTISGIFQCINYESQITPYVVLETMGEAAGIGLKNGHFRIVGYYERVKLLHVPIRAIYDRKLH